VVSRSMRLSRSVHTRRLSGVSSTVTPASTLPTVRETSIVGGCRQRSGGWRERVRSVWEWRLRVVWRQKRVLRSGTSSTPSCWSLAVEQPGRTKGDNEGEQGTGSTKARFRPTGVCSLCCASPAATALAFQ
jgi:hypothetical protein